ncbi:MAG: polyketide cyclase [Rothia sp. (in: high G+C Gram-positive bacteria)]|nr:polyketide cyclase [Rothia sp. (in: high G+C Gram-positive bacteria)]
MTDSQLRFIDQGPWVISAEIDLSASADQVYALVANPSRHADLDGGGSILGLDRGRDGLLQLGETFSQKMRLGPFPYTLTMTVTEAQENRAITWLHPGGHSWRWQIFDQGSGLLTVRETFDARQAVRAGIPLYRLYRWTGSFALNRKNIALSLVRLRRLLSQQD